MAAEHRADDRRVRSSFCAVAIEILETRSLLSASGGPTMVPNIERLSVSAAAASTTIDGYTPAEIRKAYGFDQISFGNGVTADGTGQTIAIVDAYNDPNIAADLKVFDTQFGLASADLTVVNQSGGKSLPATDAGWAGEIALDVEWAHAIAPGAKILLVEADSADTADLMAAVNYARHAAGVTTVSMSWGGSEFVSWGFGGESESQLTYDSFFQTPAGHAGVTFVAAAGDSGQSSGVQWPSSSPNVVAVGGTSLVTSDASGTYESEGPWRGFRNGTSGGFSDVEIEPTYQQVAQQSGSRSTPDVGYNADPNTGFAVYDSLAYQGSSGWSVIGGTSAGSPQWAALVAIADQGRALQGLSSLDGASQTLPSLYSVYSPPGTDAYTSTYTAEYNDIGNDGYGYTTGLGTPHAAAVVATLVGSSSSNNTSDGSNTDVTPQTPDSPVTATFQAPPPTAAVAGDSGVLRITLSNTSGTRFTGPVTVTVYASTDATMSTDDVAVGTLTLPGLDLKANKSKIVKLEYAIPSTLAAGSYSLIASVLPVSGTFKASQTVTPSSIAIAAPTVDLSLSFSGTSDTFKVRPGHRGKVTLKVTNHGNTSAAGTIDLKLLASSDGVLDTADLVLAEAAGKTISLGPGQTIKFRLTFTAPADRAAGSYSLLASMSSSLPLADGDATNDIVAILTR